MILEIQKTFNGVGFWYINNKDNTIRYQVNNIKDLNNHIIPFFMKYHLRSGKLISFLKFKYIVDVMLTRAHWNNKDVFLSLIVISSQINPLGKLGNNTRYLTLDQQKYVVEGKHPEGVNVSALDSMIKSFKCNPLNIDFLNGLIDGDGNISVSFVKLKNVIHTSFNFTIIQDIHNLQLLEEIRSYFGVGHIYTLNKNCSIFKTGSVSDLGKIILPKLGIIPQDVKGLHHITYSNKVIIPIIKRDKFLHSARIVDLLLNSNNPNIKEIMIHSYYVSREWYNKKLNNYLLDLKFKLKI